MEGKSVTASYRGDYFSKTVLLANGIRICPYYKFRFPDLHIPRIHICHSLHMILRHRKVLNYGCSSFNQDSVPYLTFFVSYLQSTTCLLDFGDWLPSFDLESSRDRKLLLSAAGLTCSRVWCLGLSGPLLMDGPVAQRAGVTVALWKQALWVPGIPRVPVFNLMVSLSTNWRK